MKISMIAAMAHNRVIGADNDMPWHLPADLKHFKTVTLGHPVVMGRRTFESIGRALPGRKNIVITQQKNVEFNGALCAHSVEEAIKLAADVEEVMIIGGGRIYESCMSRCDRLYLTFIDLKVAGDTFFPDYESHAQWVEVSREKHVADELNPHNYEFVVLERVVS